MISARTDVGDLHALDGHALDGISEFAAVIDVDAVPLLSAHADIPERQLLAAREMPRLTAAFEVRRILCVERLDRESRDALHGVAARIFTGRNLQNGSGLE